MGGCGRVGVWAGLLLALARPLHAQTDSTAAQPDSTLPRVSVVPGSVVPGAVMPAPDDVADSLRRPTPTGAVRRALVLPGWGQVYNGQAAKAPVVAGALVGLGALAVVNHTRYVRYRRAALHVGCLEDSDREVCMGPDDEAGHDEWEATGSRSFATTRALRDRLRRDRDFALLGTALAYAVQALDAYVAAQLADFDVGEDLGAAVRATPGGPALSLTLRF